MVADARGGGVSGGDPEGAPPQDNGPIRTHRTFYLPFHHQRRRRCCAATLATSALRRVYFSPLRSHQGGFPLSSPSAAVPLSPRHGGSSFRHRRGGKGVRRRGSRCRGVRSTQLLRGRWRRVPRINFGTTSLRLSRLPNRFKFLPAP